MPTVSSIFDELVLAHKKEVYVTIVTAQVKQHSAYLIFDLQLHFMVGEHSW